MSFTDSTISYRRHDYITYKASLLDSEQKTETPGDECETYLFGRWGSSTLHVSIHLHVVTEMFEEKIITQTTTQPASAAIRVIHTA